MYQDLPRSIRVWGMWCHLAGIVCSLCNALMIPFISIIVPYLVWVSGRDRHPFVNEQGRESLNFQISMAIYTISTGILLVFLFFLTCGAAISSPNSGDVAFAFNLLAIAYVVLAVLFLIFQIAVIVMAANKAYNGQSYRYPLALRFFR